MKHWKKIGAVLGIIFIVFMAVNFQRVDRVWIEWLRGAGQSYYGNINLWHINDDFSQKIPYESMLKKYEKKNFGVFINVSYMTADEAKAKIESGQYPDLITYSRNLFEKPEKVFTELERADIPMSDRGEAAGKLMAYTLYYDTYSLIINEDLISDTEEDVPAIIEPDYIMKNLINLPFKEGTIPIGFTRYGGAVNMLDALGSGDVEIPYNEISLKDFEQGRVAAAVCSSMELEKYQGEMPSYSVYQFSGFSDRGRFLSIFKCEDKNKLKCSREIAALLVGEKLQQQISEYAFSPKYGYSALKSEKEIKLTRVFENNMDKESVIAELKSDRQGLLNKMREICK